MPNTYAPDSQHMHYPQTDGLIDKNTYYHSGEITIFPSSNGVDVGKIFTELNGRHISTNITELCYVVAPRPKEDVIEEENGVLIVKQGPGGFDIHFNRETNKVDIDPGRCVINGFDVLCTETVSYRLPTPDEYYTGTKYAHKYKGKALLCLHTIFDALNNISGNIQVGDTWYCEGIHVCYPTAEEYEANENEYLLLGGVDEDGNIRINDEKFDRIDARYILIRLVPDDETNVPPIQSTNLETFINNYLHGYWVKKNGDNQYGDMIHRVLPPGYLEEKFDYHNEVPLTDTDYSVKIGKTTDQDTKTYIFNEESGYINIKHLTLQPRHECQISLRPMQIWWKDDILDADERYNFRMMYPHTKSDNTFYFTINNEHQPNDGQVRFNNINICTKSFMQMHFNKLFFEMFAIDENNNGVKNWLIDPVGDIVTKTTTPSPHQHEIRISSLRREIEFTTEQQNCHIHVRDNKVSDTWKNIFDVSDNIEVDESVWAKKFIVAGVVKDIVDSNNIAGESGSITSNPIGSDPSQITVPDFYLSGGRRRLKEGDIYAGGQVWSAAYNDYSELFDVQKEEDNRPFQPIPGSIIAVDKNGVYRVADRKKYNNIIGIVSAKPAICVGGNGDTPIALAGRVNVWLDTKQKAKKPKVGDYVGLSRREPGRVCKCSRFSKYCVGKVTNNNISNDEVEVLVIIK